MAKYPEGYVSSDGKWRVEGGQWVPNETPIDMPQMPPLSALQQQSLGMPKLSQVERIAQEAQTAPPTPPGVPWQKTAENVGLEFARGAVPRWAEFPGIPGMSLPMETPTPTRPGRSLDEAVIRSREEAGPGEPTERPTTWPGLAANIAGSTLPFSRAQALTMGSLRAIPGVGKFMGTITEGPWLRGLLPRMGVGAATTPLLTRAAGDGSGNLPLEMIVGGLTGGLSRGSLKPWVGTPSVAREPGRMQQMVREALGIPTNREAVTAPPISKYPIGTQTRFGTKPLAAPTPVETTPTGELTAGSKAAVADSLDAEFGLVEKELEGAGLAIGMGGAFTPEPVAAPQQQRKPASDQDRLTRALRAVGAIGK